jgi:hypothetical protein
VLQLVDLIALCGVTLGRFKIHLAKHEIDPPLQAYLEGRFQAWQDNQTQKNFQCETIVSLISLGYDRWLFVGVWKVDGVRPNGDRYLYKTTELPGLDSLNGRAVIRFKREFRASYLHGSRYGAHLLVTEIRPERYSIQEFPGFSRFHLEFDQLRYIVSHGIASWKSALESVAGIYLIADRATGELYVGKADGSAGIWGRWTFYATVPHGENRELKRLLIANGTTYASNFRFSILEICDLRASPAEVTARESHWKIALLSRDFGHNAN